MKVQEELKNQAAETEAVLALAIYCLPLFCFFLTVFIIHYFCLFLLCPYWFSFVSASLLCLLGPIHSLFPQLFLVSSFVQSLSQDISESLCAFVYTVFSPDQLSESFPLWGDFLTSQMVKNLPPVQETWVWSLGQDNPPEKGMATHSSLLAWKIPWTEEPGRLQSMVLQRVRHDWATNISLWYWCAIMVVLVFTHCDLVV